MSKTKIGIVPWLVWIIPALFVLYQFLLQASTSVMVPGLMISFHINIAQVGLLSSAFFYPYLILQIPAGIMVDRMGVRGPMAMCLFLVAASTLIFAFARSIVSAEISRMLMGMASAPAVVCAMTIASRWFPEKLFPMLAGLVEMLGMLGGAIGITALSYMVADLGWRHSLMWAGILGVVFFVLGIIMVRDWPDIAAKKRHLALHAQAGHFWRKVREIVKQPLVWVACFYTGLMFSLVTAFAGLWAVSFLESVYQFSSHVAAIASSVMFLGFAVGLPSIGWFADHIKRYRAIMFCCSLACVVLMVLLVYAPLPGWLAFVVMFLAGFVCGAYVLSFAVVKRVTCPSAHGTALGLTNMVCIALGAPVLQPVIGWILHLDELRKHCLCASNYQNAMLPLLVFLGIAVVLSLFISDKKCCHS